MMFNRRSDDVIARLYHPEQGEVVALGAAAGENHFGRTAVQQFGNILASMLHRGTRLLALLMNGRRIPELLDKMRPHRLKHFRQERSCGVVVEIHAMHSCLYSSC